MTKQLTFFFVTQKRADEMRISDWSSDVCSSDLERAVGRRGHCSELHATRSQRHDLGAHHGSAVAQLHSTLRRPALGRQLDVERLRRAARGQGARQLRRMGRMGDPHVQLVALGEHVEARSEEHTSELQSLMRISYAVFCLKKKNTQNK